MSISKLKEHNLLVNNTQEISEITTTLSNSNSQLPTSGAVKRLLDSITLDTFIVGGNWTNRQYPGRTPDPTGLEFIAVYRDGHRANVIANLEAPDAWSEQAGMQIATFYYTENGTTVRALKPAGIELVPTSLTVNGTMATQFYQNAPNTSGLSFTITYNNGQSSTTQSVDTSPSVWEALGPQTATFSYTENETTVTATKECTVVKIPSSLTVGGSWSNPQFYDTAPDPTGLTFTVGYNDGTSGTVSSSSISITPSVWNDIGTRTATFSYTENGITVTATKTATVIKKVQSLVVGGSWSAYQYTSEAPITTGLTYTAFYNDNSSEGVTATCITNTWGSIAGSQSAEFSYTENGITVTAYYDANVVKKLKSLSYSGTWPQEREGQPVSIYGITFTATYMDDTTKSDIAVTTISPAIWATNSGQQTATFYYTENGITVSTTKTIGMTYSISYSSSTGGSASGATAYTYSSSAQTKSISSSASVGYSFSSWSVTGLVSGSASASGSTLTIGANAYGNITVKANFSISSTAITVAGPCVILRSSNVYTNSSRTSAVAAGTTVNKNGATYYYPRGGTYTLDRFRYNGYKDSEDLVDSDAVEISTSILRPDNDYLDYKRLRDFIANLESLMITTADKIEARNVANWWSYSDESSYPIGIYVKSSSTRYWLIKLYADRSPWINLLTREPVYSIILKYNS